MNLNETKSILKKYGITPNKSLGQNFLIDEEIQANIIEELNVNTHDLIIEIGPGVGALSKTLAKICTSLVLIEIDEQLVHILSDLYSDKSTVDLINADALKFNYRELLLNKRNEFEGITSVKVISNLPYYITTPLISKLIDELPECERMIFTLQKEAADRIMSGINTGEYGVLPVVSKFLYNMTTSLIIPAKSFFPEPTVESVVMRMHRREGINLKREDIIEFGRFVKAAFSKRRKMLTNSLPGSYQLSGGKEALITALAERDLSLKVRAQELSPEVFWSLFLQLRTQ